MAQIDSIFKFLKEYDQISNPIITEINRQKWNLKLVNIPRIKEINSIYETMDFESDKILEVVRPLLEPCPLPDENIIPWIENDWKDVDVDKIQYRKKIVKNTKDEDGNTVSVEVYFNDEHERVLAFEKWIEKREAWRANELPKKRGLDLYNELFSIYSHIKRESESFELMLGDGRVKWRSAEYTIDHPAFLQKVKLKFDSKKPSFIIECEELKTELYVPMFRVIKSVNQQMVFDILKELEATFYHIADKANMVGLFKRLINVIDKRGRYVESFDEEQDNPVILHEPILFLRKRNLGFSGFIDKVIEDIERREDFDLPNFFQNMVGNYRTDPNGEFIEDAWNPNGIAEDVLLTLPANKEQLRIVKYLNNHGAVLVQGPPGTGKTHTIANLIGHLLSQGNSVLVTSHTEKALTVLKDKVDKNLQSLCISLLSSSSQKKEMDSSLFEIAEKNTSFNLHESEMKIKRLIEERRNLIERYKSKRSELLKIRSFEYKDIVYENETITPIDAAKFINEGRGKIDYILGETTDDTVGLPLSIEELKNLYRSNKEISPEEEKILGSKIPDIEEIWDATTFASKPKEYEKLKKELHPWNPGIFLKSEIAENKKKELLGKINAVVKEFDAFGQFQYAIINKAIKDSVYKELWYKIFDNLDILLPRYHRCKKIYFEYELVLPEELVNEETIITLNEIIESNKEVPVSGINLLIKPKWKNLRDKIKINGKNVEKIDDYKTVKFVIQYKLERKDLCNKINKLLSQVFSEYRLGIGNFEENIIQIRKKIEKALDWHRIWSELIKELEDWVDDHSVLEDLSMPDFFDTIEQPNGNLDVSSFEIENLVKKLKYYSLKSGWSSYFNFLNQYKHLGCPFKELVNAVISRETESYERNYRLLENIYSKMEIYGTRKSLLEKLRLTAPKWAEDISERKGIHGESKLPEKIKEAWKWRQLSNQLERIDSYDPNMIQKEIDEINEALRNNAKALAYEKAWYEKIRNTTNKQTQALQGWRQTIKQIGKGKGKSAPRLKKKARELMPLCQSAIPVWIMPLNRVAENFDPSKNKFDVVIIDEASQADILALSVLYLGKKVIIVGDDEQVSPDNIGMEIEKINALIDQYLQDIPNNHLFNGKTSIYDITKTSGFKPLMLTEHFRCLPEIIEFSNQLSYNGKIKPLRDATGVKTLPAVVEYRVPDGVAESRKINIKEAEHIASLVCACIEDKSYKNKTIGVISMLGEEQANEINKLLQRHLDPKEYEKRKIQCGTSRQFQGDERDIIFISIVKGPKDGGGPVTLLSEDGRNDMYKKRFNVAASRARDQMWIVHSLNPEIDLKPDDIRLKLIKYAMNPSLRSFDSKLEKAESDFERKVMKTLLNKGYKVIPQYKVGAYRIDMVIEDGKRRIALECDGERYHTLENLSYDLERQAILERLGWRFIRIRGSAYYRNPEETMEWLYNELESYEIRPNFKEQEDNVSEKTEDYDDLVAKIKRKANEIRNRWEKEEAGFFTNEENALDEFENDNQGEISSAGRIEESFAANLEVEQRTDFAADSDYRASFQAPQILSPKPDERSKGVYADIITNKKDKEKMLQDTANDLKDLKNKARDFTEQKRAARKNTDLKPLFDFRKKA